VEDLRRASDRLRQDIARPGWPGALLIECSGLRAGELPADDTELWLRLAAGVASPQGTDDWGAPDAGDDESDEAESELAAICAIDHFDWLAAITALAEGGPGTAASAASLAGYVRDYDPEDPEDPDGGDPGEADEPDEPDEVDEPDELDDEADSFYLSDDDEYDDLTMESLFLPVTSLWRVLGAIDDDERLTALGWWGLPEAMLRVWAPTGGAQN
jgi:hypothetical protein